MARALLALITLFALTTTAAAEPPPGGYEQQPEYYDPNYPPDAQPVQAEPYPEQGYATQPVAEPQPYPQQAVVVEEPSAEQGRGLQYGATVFVPIWLGDIANQIRPGIGIRGRVGWEMRGGLSFELGGAATWNADSGLYLDGSLVSVNISLGARYAFLNPSALVPFVQAAAQVNFWNACTDDGYCSEYGDVTGGFNAGGGLIFELTQNAALEAGLTVTGTSAGSILKVPGSDRSFWVQLNPFIGFTLYF